MKQTWTEEMVVALCRGYAAGHSCGQIAKDIGGLTRNAVIGKARRLGLVSNARPPKVARRPPSKLRAERSEAQQETQIEPVSLFDLEPHHCRYSVSGEGADTLFCAATKHLNYSYCLKHCQIVFRDFAPTEKTLGREDDTAHQGARS
jgi:hypothetical protein